MHEIIMKKINQEAAKSQQHENRVHNGQTAEGGDEITAENEANDKFLRLFSEFDNYRKRTAKERIELTKTANADMITAMLPVLDDLERATNIEGNNDDASPVSEGLILILNKFKGILRQKGVEEIRAIGELFNTDFHEAVTHVPATKQDDKGKVLEELQKGYLLNGKVIRYARVVVAN